MRKYLRWKLNYHFKLQFNIYTVKNWEIKCKMWIQKHKNWNLFAYKRLYLSRKWSRAFLHAFQTNKSQQWNKNKRSGSGKVCTLKKCVFSNQLHCIKFRQCHSLCTQWQMYYPWSEFVSLCLWREKGCVKCHW